MADKSRSLLITGIFTITPTHCGTGQASGAVDLPIAREAHTQLPLLPASSLKGIARDDWFRLPGKRDRWSDDEKHLYEAVVKPLFGPLPPRRRLGNGAATDAQRTSESESERGTDGRASEDLSAGDLVFLDGLLLCFPVRSLTGGFRLVTSPLLLHRLHRIVKSQGRKLVEGFTCPVPLREEAVLPAGEDGPLSLEDLVFPKEGCRQDAVVTTLAETLGRLAARDQSDADRKLLSRRLVVVSDEVLQDLTVRATPVAARIVLSEKKTSDNLWYEETLPPDCLFAAVILARPGAESDPIGKLTTALGDVERYTQIGGNASVGQGQCRWVLRPDPEVLA